MIGLRRLTERELVIGLVFMIVLASLGLVAYLESEVTPVWKAAPERISLGADGLGVFIWKVEGGFWTRVAGRKGVFDISPSAIAQIVSLNGNPVGKASGIEPSDRSGRVVVVVRVSSEGPVQLRGVDLRSGRSVTAVRWSVAG
ncbi:MAG: hypothetical protein HYY46_02705 [Deltaproteobacteria bacterium]|nr:hypothetical protein [Deltaproteobacteria bacterium]